jgi:hypothetical protein
MQSEQPASGTAEESTVLHSDLILKREISKSTSEPAPAENDSQGPNPPTGYVTSPPTGDPAAALLNVIFKGIRLDEPLLPNRYALVYLLPNGIQIADVKQLHCKATFTTDKSYFVSNVNGIAVNSTFELKYQSPKCNLNEVNAMIEVGAKVFNFANNPSKMKALQLKIPISAFGIMMNLVGKQIHVATLNYCKPSVAVGDRYLL